MRRLSAFDSLCSIAIRHAQEKPRFTPPSPRPPFTSVTRAYLRRREKKSNSHRLKHRIILVLGTYSLCCLAHPLRLNHRRPTWLRLPPPYPCRRLSRSAFNLLQVPLRLAWKRPDLLPVPLYLLLLQLSPFLPIRILSQPQSHLHMRYHRLRTAAR